MVTKKIIFWDRDLGRQIWKPNAIFIIENGAYIQLNANNIFGIMRGLETVLQLAFVEGFEEGHTNLDGLAPAANFLSIKNTPISIEDAPRFPWRGMLVDTARHYFSIEKLKQIIDALSWNKMNVFHWHIVDAEVRHFECPNKATHANFRLVDFSARIEVPAGTFPK